MIDICFTKEWKHKWTWSPITLSNKVTSRFSCLSKTFFRNSSVKFSMIPPEKRVTMGVLRTQGFCLFSKNRPMKLMKAFSQNWCNQLQTFVSKLSYLYMFNLLFYLFPIISIFKDSIVFWIIHFSQQTIQRGGGPIHIISFSLLPNLLILNKQNQRWLIWLGRLLYFKPTQASVQAGFSKSVNWEVNCKNLFLSWHKHCCSKACTESEWQQSPDHQPQNSFS